MTSTELFIPVSVGELIDKITILQIKNERIDDKNRLVNVRKELAQLSEVLAAQVPASPELRDLTIKLKDINEQLWTVEDDIRAQEAEKSFGEEFISLARSVYQLNDQRAQFKRDISLLLGSDIIEEKSYHPT